MSCSHGYSEGSTCCRIQQGEPQEQEEGKHSVGKSQVVTGTIAFKFVIPVDLPVALSLNGTEPINRQRDNDKDPSQDRGELI